ncbi:MAG: hypothetical protein LBE78_13040 [Burkholderiaceae bacterium]|jgi:hypothetical protein|nr:hypothetical protein [Burkholderiaceae bacterium]
MRDKTPTRPPAQVSVAPERAAAIDAAQDQAAMIQAASDEALTLGVNLGRIEALDFISTVVNSAILPIYENIKKSRTWQHLRNPQNSDGRNFSSLDEFCRVKFGKSYTRIQEIAANRRFIGEEAFDQAERLGLRQIDYNALRALPPPKQEIVREALADGASKEEVQRALRELAASDQKEIESLTKERDESKADLDAKDKVLDDTQKKLRDLQVQLKKKVVAVTDWPDALQPITEQVAAAGRKIATGLSELETCRITLFTAAQDIPEAERPQYEAALAHVAEVYEEALARAERVLQKERITYDKSLGAYTPGEA